MIKVFPIYDHLFSFYHRTTFVSHQFTLSVEKQKSRLGLMPGGNGYAGLARARPTVSCSLPTADDFLPLLGHGHKGDKKLAQLLTLLVHEYFDRELVDQANALKVLTVLCALPNPQSRAHVRFLTMGVNFEWDREAFTQDFAGATWKVVAPLIRHFASQEKELAELDDQAVLLPSLALIVKRLRDMKALQLGTLNERQVKFLRALARYKAP